MDRRRFVQSLGVGIGGACLGCAGQPSLAPAAKQATPPKRPNVVIFVSDDMGWSDVGYHESRIQTPHIDRLAAEGVQLDRFYVFPVCSPTRTALMTGRSPIRCGIVTPLGNRSPGPPLDDRFLSQAFQAAGYQTFMVGKWHLGGGSERNEPRGRGFDHFYGFLGGFIDYYKHTAREGGPIDWQRNGKTVNEEGYSTDLFAQEAVRLLKGRDRTRPVLLYVPFNAPHIPHQAPEALVRKYEKLGFRGRRSGYAAVVDAMDQAIGKVLAALDAEGMRDDTLVMFFCDNGGGGGRGGAPPRPGAGNYPFRGGKGSVLEGGIHVPAVIRWPAVLKAGTRSSQVVTATDLFPTLAAAAGVEPGNTKPLDGENVWPAIRDGEVVARKGIVIGLRDLAVLDGPWKLIQSGEKSQLYNLEDDPTEKHDLAAKHPDVVEKLKAVQAPFAALIKSAPAAGPRRRRPPGARPPRRRPGRRDGAPGRPERPWERRP